MPLTPSEEKLLRVLSEKSSLASDEQALKDVLEEKSREVGIFVTPGAAGPYAENIRAFANQAQEYVMLGVDRNGQAMIVVSYPLHAAAGHTMTALLRQVALVYENRLQKILEAKMTSS